jgi:hypothetical protein
MAADIAIVEATARLPLFKERSMAVSIFLIVLLLVRLALLRCVQASRDTGVI